MSVNLSPNDELAQYYKARGIGQHMAIPGAIGLGSGVSHYAYRVPKNIYNRGPTRANVRKMKQNEYKARMAAQAAERAAGAVVRQREMNANVAGIVYTNEPTIKIDIDLPINLASLADRGFQLAAKKKWDSLSSGEKNQYLPIHQSKKTNGPNLIHYGSLFGKGKQILLRPGFAPEEEIMIKENKVTIDDALTTLVSAFVETEKNKVRMAITANVKRNLPNWTVHHNRRGVLMRDKQQKNEIEKRISEHIARKMPKIDTVINKLREGMILGFPPSLPKATTKEENLLGFENLSSINFSGPTGPAAAGFGAPPAPNDPFAGLNVSTNLTFNDFVRAGIEIEPETISHLSKNQKEKLLELLKGLDKSKHNNVINSFLEAHFSVKGGKQTRRVKKNYRKTRKTN